MPAGARSFCEALRIGAAVAINAGQIKTGSVCRGERTAKYNQLLRIGKNLGLVPSILAKKYSVHNVKFFSFLGDYLLREHRGSARKSLHEPSPYDFVCNKGFPQLLNPKEGGLYGCKETRKKSREEARKKSREEKITIL